MAWKLLYTETAEKQLSKLDRSVVRSIKTYLAHCAELEDPASRGHGLTGAWAGFHCYRVGQLRIIVEIRRGVVTIVVVTMDRRDVIYK